MKIYLISNVPSGGDELENVLDNANISVISKDLNGSIDEIEEEIVKRLENSNANMLIFVTDDTIGATMALNKHEGLRAATCNTVEDLSAARANGANVIILDDERAQKEEIAQAIVKGGGGIGKLLQMTKTQKKKEFVERPAERQVERRERPLERQPQAYKPQPGAPISINIKIPQLFGAKKKVKEKEVEETVLPAGKARPGIIGKIKDELGIID